MHNLRFLLPTITTAFFCGTGYWTEVDSISNTATLKLWWASRLWCISFMANSVWSKTTSRTGLGLKLNPSICGPERPTTSSADWVKQEKLDFQNKNTKASLKTLWVEKISHTRNFFVLWFLNWFFSTPMNVNKSSRFPLFSSRRRNVFPSLSEKNNKKLKRQQRTADNLQNAQR